MGARPHEFGTTIFRYTPKVDRVPAYVIIGLVRTYHRVSVDTFFSFFLFFLRRRMCSFEYTFVI